MAAREFYGDTAPDALVPYGTGARAGQYGGYGSYSQSQSPLGYPSSPPHGALPRNPDDPFGYPTVPTYNKEYTALAPPPLGQPQPQPGYLSPYPLTVQSLSSSPGSSHGPPGSDFDPGPGGTTDRGLGSTLIGGASGAYLAHKMGGGKLGAMVGAVAGAAMANAVGHKSKEKKKKREKKHGSYRQKKHSHHHNHKHRTSSESGSDNNSGSDSDSIGSGRIKYTSKRYALGYSTGGGSVFGGRRRRKSSSRSGRSSSGSD